IQTDSGMTAPSGVAIIGFWNNGMIVSETGVPASVSVGSGLISAEIGGQVKNCVGVANPNNESSLVTFFFFNSNGSVVRQGSFVLRPNQHVSAFLDQLPFAGPNSFKGTFKFIATAPVSVVALLGHTNQRNEFLMTTLPLIPVGSGPAGGSMIIPEF